MEGQKMKKMNITPLTKTKDADLYTMMLSVSGGGIGYGGVDTDGTLDPDTKQRDVEWEEL